MVQSIFEHLYPQLDEVGKFIKFGRKKAVSVIKDSLAEFENYHTKLQSKHDALTVENADFKSKIDLLNSTISKKETEYTQLDTAHSLLVAQHDHTNNLLSAKNMEYDQLHSKHDTLTTKHSLISSLLSVRKNNNPAMEKFSTLLRNDFMDFANNESSLKEEAKTILILQDIETQLQRIVDFSEIANKKMVAVGGGFSAGKSEFLNSFFQTKDIQLSVGIKPVTAIPTYITSGSKNIIKGYSYRGGVVNIANDLHRQLSHDFMKEFSFNLKDIMPVMAIETPIEAYKNICFIDTPGYNPSNTDSFTNQDFDTAQEYLSHSHILLWLIGLDSNGTFPYSDLDFINKLSLDNKKLYIIANKADLKCEEDLNDVLDIFEELLDGYDIEYEGISAYSSIYKKEIMYRRISLFDFLQQENNQIQVQQQILFELNSIFEMYRNAINTEMEWMNEIRSNLKSLELDLVQVGCDINDEIVFNRLKQITNMFQSNNLEQQLNELNNISIVMTQSVKRIFSSLSNKAS